MFHFFISRKHPKTGGLFFVLCQVELAKIFEVAHCGSSKIAVFQRLSRLKGKVKVVFFRFSCSYVVQHNYFREYIVFELIFPHITI